MIHADEDCEGLERVQLDDYDDYLLDPLDENKDATMDSEFPDNIKVEDTECRRLINAKRVKGRQHTVEMN
jgi:hypothetical protein